VDPPAPTFDRPLPFIGRLGRRIKRKRRGLGYAFGSAFRTLLVVSKLSLTSRRTHVILWNRRWALLTSLGAIVVYGGLIVVVMNSGTFSPLYVGGMMVLVVGGALSSTLRRHDLEAWPLMALKQRRCALMYGSRRYRDLHVGAGVDQTPGQLEHYIASRRIHWRERLAGLKHSQRSAFAYREFWWMSLPSAVFFVAYFFQIGKTGAFPFGVFAPFLLFQVFVYLVPSLVASHRLKRLRRSLEELSCPDCGYPLADFALGSWRGHQVQGLGPRRCTECGCPWPLIPPPRGRVSK
jgi:uncharacterized membrane protein YhaH (DUF805 family)